LRDPLGFAGFQIGHEDPLSLTLDVRGNEQVNGGYVLIGTA